MKYSTKNDVSPCSHTTSVRVKPKTRLQSGFTLIELLVALVISTVVALAAFSALFISRQGFTAVDAASQLRDNARFTTDLIQRLTIQSGYLSDRLTASTISSDASLSDNPEPNVRGFNNSLASTTLDPNAVTSRPSSSVDGSDVLILRFQADETYPNSGISDSSIIDCSGNSLDKVPLDRQDRVWNVLHIQVSATDGEPSLMCSRASTGTTTVLETTPIIRGVETFQVLYGVDSVSPGLVTASTTAPNVPTAYLRADQLVVPGNTVDTNKNWQRVRSIRIGMVLRGPLGSANQRSDATTTYYPLGAGIKQAGAAKGTGLSSSIDPGTIFIPGADTRLRQVVSFTVHLRNDQDT